MEFAPTRAKCFLRRTRRRKKRISIDSRLASRELCETFLTATAPPAEAEGAVVRLILKNKSPVAGEHLPGDEVRLLGSEERYGVGDVLGRAESAERRLLRQLRQHLRRERVKHVRPDDARRDAVHADLRRRELRRE